MSQHTAIISWKRTSDEYLRGKYSREHTWTFDGGVSIPASSAPAVVPAPWSNPAGVDPEEAFVASISSCHMLTYLFVAQRKGFVIDSYEDNAVGEVTKNDRGIPWVNKVMLNPKIVYGGEKQPTAEEVDQMHHVAHEQCFISNSIKTEVTVAPGA